MTKHPSHRRFALSLAVVALAIGVGSLRGGATTRPAAKVETLPASRGGQEVVGTKLPVLAFDRWLPDVPPTDGAGRPPVTLYRWWTTGCPFCEKTLPAIEQLRQRHEKDGLRVVAVFHPKPPGAVDDDPVAKAAKRMGFGGRVAIDEDWSELKRAYLDRSKTARATSVTLLVDREGVIRFVHPGTQFFPSKEPGEGQEDADYRLLEKAIDSLPAAD